MSASVTAKNVMHFDTLAKDSPVNSKKNGAVPSVVIKDYENKF